MGATPSRFDVVLGIKRFGDIAQSNLGWGINVSRDEIKDGTVVGVLGPSGSGKTHLLDQISPPINQPPLKTKADYAIGLGLRQAVIRKRNFITMQSMNTDRPLPSAALQDDIPKAEEFLTRFIIEQSDYVIIVVNKFDRSTQEYVTKIRSMMKVPKPTFVVHNFYRSVCPGDEHVQKAYGGIENVFSTRHGIKTYDLKYYQDENVRHVVYGLGDTADWVVIEAFRTWLTTLIGGKGQPTDVSLTRRLKQDFKPLLQDYFEFEEDLNTDSQSHIRMSNTTTAVKLKVGSVGPGQVATAHGRAVCCSVAEKKKFVNAQIAQAESFITEQNERITRLKQIQSQLEGRPDESQVPEYAITLKAPGVDLSSVNIDIFKSPNRAGFWQINFSGQSENIEQLRVVSFQSEVHVPSEYQNVNENRKIGKPLLLGQNNGLLTYYISKMDIGGDNLNLNTMEAMNGPSRSDRSLWYNEWANIRAAMKDTEEGEEIRKKIIAESSELDLMEFLPILIGKFATNELQNKFVTAAVAGRQGLALILRLNNVEYPNLGLSASDTVRIQRSHEWISSLVNIFVKTAVTISPFTEVGLEYSWDKDDIIVPAGTAAHGPWFAKKVKYEQKFSTKLAPVKVCFTNELNHRNRMIFKSGDMSRDVRVLFLFRIFNSIWETEIKDKPPVAHIYRAFALGAQLGCVEFVDSIPMSQVDMTAKSETQLRDTIPFTAGTIVAGFLIELRDRHKDNILAAGSSREKMFHIDFQYLFGQSPTNDGNTLPISKEYTSETASNRSPQLWADLEGKICLAYETLRKHEKLICDLVDFLFPDEPARKCVKEHFSHGTDKFKQMLREAPFAWDRWFKNVMHGMKYFASSH